MMQSYFGNAISIGIKDFALVYNGVGHWSGKKLTHDFIIKS